MYRRWRRRKKPKPGIHGRPPFPAQSIVGNLSRRSRVRYAAPNYGAPLTTASGSQEKSLRRGKGGLWDIGSQSCPTAQRFVSDPPAVPRWRRLHDGASLPDVPLKLFRGRPVHSNSIFVDGVMLFPQMDVW